MKKFLFSLIILLAQSASAEKLFSFDKNAVIFNTLSHIKLRYSDLARMELSPHSNLSISEKDGELFVSVFFSYKTDSKLGMKYVCVKVDKNGELIKVQRDIEPKKVLFDHLLPDYSYCR